MFETKSPFNIIPKVNVDRCLEFTEDSTTCKRSNGSLVYSFTLRCLSRQMFPNGTIIDESSLAENLSVERYVDNITEDMEPLNRPLTGETNIGASVITALVVIVVFVAVALVCYAQKYKVSFRRI